MSSQSHGEPFTAWTIKNQTISRCRKWTRVVVLKFCTCMWAVPHLLVLALPRLKPYGVATGGGVGVMKQSLSFSLGFTKYLATQKGPGTAGEDVGSVTAGQPRCHTVMLGCGRCFCCLHPFPASLLLMPWPARPSVVCSSKLQIARNCATAAKCFKDAPVGGIYLLGAHC